MNSKKTQLTTQNPVFERHRRALAAVLFGVGDTGAFGHITVFLALLAGSQYSPRSFAGGGLVVPLTVTFTRRARRTTIHPATVDGLWVAAVTGHYTAARCHTPGRLPDSFQRRNNDGAAPFIELWPETKLETLLAQKSYLAAAHGLR